MVFIVRIDDLSLSYNGNQLQAVNDQSVNSAYKNGFEFKDGAKQDKEYFYDSNGNLTKDLNKKIPDIRYNYLNLPARIEFEDGNSVSYLYNANGTKLRTMHVMDKDTLTTDYLGNAIFENGVLTKLLTRQGYITLSDKTYHYYIQDHQGNNRVVVDQSGTVEEENHYYPFGGVFASTSSVQPYKYNGKELDRRNGLDWYDYGARMYDAALGRWNAVDPISSKFHALSPYIYCKNNPVSRIDIDGKDDYTINNIGILSRTSINSSPYDRLFSSKKGVDPIIVKDKSLLLGMSNMQKEALNLSREISTSNLEDATAIFKFGADNTSVEWKLDIYDDEESKTAIVGTEHKASSVFSDKQSELQVKGNKIVDLHSHPYNEKASDNDMQILKIETGAIYYKDKKSLFFYSNNNSHINNENYTIDTSVELLRILNDKFMK